MFSYCEQNNILVQVYGSLFKGQHKFLYAPEVALVGEETGATPAQILLRWALQKGFQVIPKSTKVHRVNSENSNLKEFPHLEFKFSFNLNGREPK